MSWVGFGILFKKYPQFHAYIEKLQKYVEENELQAEDTIDLSHASVCTDIPERKLKEILERGINFGIFQKVYRLRCNIKEGFVDEQETPYFFPLEIFCDLCGEEHSFTEQDVAEGYKLKFDLPIQGPTEDYQQLEHILSEKEIKEIENQMPILCSYASNLSDSKPFDNKIFLIVLHFLKDLIIFLKKSEDLGLTPNKTYVFWKPYLYPHKYLIASHLRREGYNVYPLEELENVLKELNQETIIEDIVVIEDGGYITPLLHKKFNNLLKRAIGAIEQTSRGIRNNKEIKSINIPILNVAESRFKATVEPPHVADAVVGNIKNFLSFELLRGKEATLMGFGTIGKNIASSLKNNGINVTVYDPDFEKLSEAKEIPYNVEDVPERAVKDKFLIIGCSGETSIGEKEILNLKNNTYLVSASSDQREIGMPVLKSLQCNSEIIEWDNKKIGTAYLIRGKNDWVKLIADGYPINFWFSESMPNQVSDVILSLIFLSAIELIGNKDEFVTGINSVNNISEKYKVPEKYYRHTRS